MDPTVSVGDLALTCWISLWGQRCLSSCGYLREHLISVGLFESGEWGVEWSASKSAFDWRGFVCRSISALRKLLVELLMGWRSHKVLPATRKAPSSEACHKSNWGCLLRGVLWQFRKLLLQERRGETRGMCLDRQTSLQKLRSYNCQSSSTQTLQWVLRSLDACEENSSKYQNVS